MTVRRWSARRVIFCRRSFQWATQRHASSDSFHIGCRIGQPTPFSHPHLFASEDEICVGLRRGDFEDRRRRFFELLPCHSVAVFLAADVSVRTHDIEHPFRQNTDFWYLTGCQEPSAVAVFTKTIRDERSFALFVREKCPESELWHGASTGVAMAQRFFGPSLCRERDRPETVGRFVRDQILSLAAAFQGSGGKPTVPRVYFSCPRQVTFGLRDATAVDPTSDASAPPDPLFGPHCLHSIAKAILSVESPSKRGGGAYAFPAFVAARHGVQSHYAPHETAMEVRPTASITNQLRGRKAAADAAMFLRSAVITAHSFREGMRSSFTPTASVGHGGDSASSTSPLRGWLPRQDPPNERHVYAAMVGEAMRCGAAGLAYIPVVAGGANACALHYISNDLPFKAGDLVVVDAGAEFHGYPTDCTRTWPVSGRFSAAQSALYKAVLEVQQHLFGLCAVGVPYNDLHKAAVVRMADHLRDLGIGPVGAKKRGDGGDAAEIVAQRLFTMKFFPHNFGHFMGCDIHEEVDHTTTLFAGAMHTIEPGIYFPDVDAHRQETAFVASQCGLKAGKHDRLAEVNLEWIPPEFRGVGIRIEDNVIVLDPRDRAATTAFLEETKMRLAAGLRSVDAAHDIMEASLKAGRLPSAGSDEAPRLLVTTACVPRTLAEVEAACGAR